MKCPSCEKEITSLTRQETLIYEHEEGEEQYGNLDDQEIHYYCPLCNAEFDEEEAREILGID